MLYYIMFAITFFFVIIYWLSVLFLRLKIADFLKPIVMFLNGANIAVTAIAIIYTLSLNRINMNIKGEWKWSIYVLLLLLHFWL